MPRRHSQSAIETELRARVDDPREFRLRLQKTKARLADRHIMRDFSYDLPDGRLKKKKQKLRLRIYDNRRTVMAWKAKTQNKSEYKEEYEHEVEIDSFEEMMTILEGLGYHLTFRIDRRVEIYTLGDVNIRLEFFPEMDALVEIEGPRAALEKTIRMLEMKRSEFNGKGQEFFFEAYAKRTGHAPRTFYEKEGFSRSVGAIVLNPRNQILILFQKKSQYWEFPKGQIKRGERDLQTLRRELREETGITKLQMKDGFRETMYFDFILNPKTLIHREVTFYLVKTSQTPVLSLEHTDMKWVKLSVVKRYLARTNQHQLIDQLKFYLSK